MGDLLDEEQVIHAPSYMAYSLWDRGVGFGGDEEVIQSAGVLETLLCVQVVSMCSVGARISGVKTCLVAGFFVGKVGEVHAASI